MKEPRSLKSWPILLVLLGTLAYALAEDLTLTTYYPSPRGVYQELRTSGDVAIGTTSAPSARLEVRGAAGGTALALVNAAGHARLLVPTTGELLLGLPTPSATAPAQFGVFRSEDQTGAACPWWVDENGNSTQDAGECKWPSFLVTPAGQVGIGTTAPNQKALLDVTSTTKGMLLPRLTIQQRIDLAASGAADEGLLVYNKDTHALEVYTGTAGGWKSVGTGGGGGFRVYDVPGTQTFMIPDGVTSLTVEVWGGGGGGGGERIRGCGSLGSSGGGGGGGGYGRAEVTVVPRANYQVDVGTGGGGGISNCDYSTNGDAGGTSSFSTLVSANGGQGGFGGVDGGWGRGGSGGTSGASTNIPGFPGADGTNNPSCHYPPGSSNLSPPGGAGGEGGNGGAGGAGGCDSSNAAGSVPGGGGGGGGGRGAGVGGPGRVILTW